MNKSTLMILIAATTLAAQAQAAYETGAYVGGGLGSTKLEALDDSGGSFRVQGGYQFNPYLAIEGGVDLLAAIEREYCYYDYCGGSEDQLLYGVSVGLAGAMPLGESFNLLVKAGLLMWETTIDDDSVADGTDPYYGLGASYQFNQHMELALLYTRYDLGGFSSSVSDTLEYSNNDKVSNISLLFNYRF